MHGATYPYDISHNGAAFYPTLLFSQYFFTFHSSIILGTLDTVGPNMMMIMKAYLEILNRRLRALGYETDRQEAERRLRECLEFHKVCVE